ncbi:predicted protein [Uncinocarpus reesii 1704]|uniref:F-box domain-containing protein n=1 Tax=Uncinocarpus reesii (strain UAMH 1704) TaxID=336963 RepID=C4JMW9_UNCRE|nr:uncharacterized protein UREG_04177 [Uncinocarpus reesii 1704]EEP79331.1 predicted protein [Uncinocarpus reesii 1704]
MPSVSKQHRFFLDLADQCLLSLRRANHANSKKAHLLGLPLELLWEVTQYLPPASAKVLTYTCQKFYYSSSTWLAKSRLFPADCFEMLCLLERDRILSTFACGGCQRLHDCKEFPLNELRKPPFVRRCFVTVPVIDLCFSHSLCFRDALRANMVLRDSPQYARIGWESSEICCSTQNGTPSIELDHHLVVAHDQPGLGILTIFTVCNLAESNNLPQKHELAEALANHSNLSICSHIRLNDPKIVALYDRETILDEATQGRVAGRNWIFEDARDEELVTCEEEHCESFSHWVYIWDDPQQQQGSGRLQLLSFRDLGALEDPWDPRWVVHTPFRNRVKGN